MKRVLLHAFAIAAAALLGFAVVLAGGFDHPVDRALPLWAAIVAVLAVSCMWAGRPGPQPNPGRTRVEGSGAGRPGHGGIALGVPLLLAAAIAVPDERARHFAYGIVLALAFCAAVADGLRRDGVPVARATLVLVLLVAIRAVPFDAGAIVPLALLAAGAAALARALAVPALFEIAPDAAVSLGRLLVAGAIVWITPAAPLDAALVPLVVAILLVARSGNYAAMAVSLLLAIVVGRWMVVAGALAIAPAFAAAWLGRRREGNATFAIPLGYGHAAVAGLAFAPGALRGLVTVPAADGIAAVLILALSFAVRPMPSLLLALLALLLPLDPRERSGGFAAVPAAFAVALVSASAWSGATAPAFPLLAEPWVWIALALAGAIGAAIPGVPVRAVIAAAAAVAVVALVPPAPRETVPLRRSLAPGESFVIAAPPGARAVDLVLSGANVSNTTRNTVVATVSVLDATGRGARREVRLRELADWAAFREGDLFRTLNPLPRRPEWSIEGTGREAMLRGEGRIELRAEAPIARVEVRAADGLAPNARVQVERIEVPAR
ncbi:MAG: hypothetical protein ACRD2J_03915 [Thermoanaerobaculia bacterium]